MKNSPSCGCCDTSYPGDCCASGTPTTGFTVVISGMTGSSCIFDSIGGCVCTIDCSDFNGTYALTNNGTCAWTATFSLATVGCGTLTGRVSLSIANNGANRDITIIGGIDYTGNACLPGLPAPNIFLAQITTATACDALSAEVIELLGDALFPGTECCPVGAAAEAEITAV